MPPHLPRWTHLAVLPRQMTAQPDASAPADWSLQLVAQAEKSWTVSGTSVLSAWGMAFVGSVSPLLRPIHVATLVRSHAQVLILLLFSWRRRKDAMTHLPRYLALIHREPTVASKRVRGEWHPYIPTSDPSREPTERYKEETDHTDKQKAIEEKAIKEKATKEKATKETGSGPAGEKLSTMEQGESFFAWLRPGWRDFLVELNILNRKGAEERDKKYPYIPLNQHTTAHIADC